MGMSYRGYCIYLAMTIIFITQMLHSGYIYDDVTRIYKDNLKVLLMPIKKQNMQVLIDQFQLGQIQETKDHGVCMLLRRNLRATLKCLGLIKVGN